jgi:hypothetical protein
MKKLFLLLMMCGFAMAAVAQQSLGDVARANRANKKGTATTKLDDDSLPHSTASAAANDSDAAKKTDEKADDKSKTADNKDAVKTEVKDADKADAKDAKKDPAEAQKQKNAELVKQMDTQKKEIATLQRELDVAQREARLHSAAYYADAGVMLRDQAKFAEDSRKEQDEINIKKQALDAAQQKLTDLQELARKAGLPSE